MYVHDIFFFSTALERRKHVSYGNECYYCHNTSEND